jgi:hypothetical protein
MGHDSTRRLPYSSCVARTAWRVAIVLVASGAASRAPAQTTADPPAKPPLVHDSLAGSDANEGSQDQGPSADLGKTGDRIFGVMPNYSTVEGATRVEPLAVTDMFKMTALNSFDPYVFSFVAVVAGIQHQAGASYASRYATAFTDNATGNFMTSAVFPAVFHQDPRYFARGHGGVWHRAAYALTRSVVTRSRSGEAQFNVSEIGGNAVAAGLSNLYYGPDARTLAGTATRFATQVMWDSLSNELKEFWPDIRERIRSHRSADAAPATK